MDVREIPVGASHVAAAALLELRPHAGPAAALVERVDAIRAEGYRLAGSFAAGEEAAVAVAGFRIMDNLVSGRHLYVDDLVTRPEARGSGHGEALMAWLEDEARRDGCASLQLDSAVSRQAAHRFYFRRRLVIAAYHFAREL